VPAECDAPLAPCDGPVRRDGVAGVARGRRRVGGCEPERAGGDRTGVRAAARSHRPRTQRLEPGMVALRATLVALERSRGDNKEIAIVRANGDIRSDHSPQAAVAPGRAGSFSPRSWRRRATTPASAGRRRAAVRVHEHGGEGTTTCTCASPTAALRVSRLTGRRTDTRTGRRCATRSRLFSGRSGKATYICSISSRKRPRA